VGHGLRWLITGISTCVVFAVVWWIGQGGAGLDRGSALTVAGVVTAAATTGLGWWAAQETPARGGEAWSSRSTAVAASVGENAISGDNNTITTTTYVHLPAQREPARRVRWLGSMPMAAAGFVDRPEYTELQAVLEGTSRVVVAAVAGGRGVGKTQLAAAYCRARDRADWPVVVWLNAESASSMLADLARLAEHVGCQPASGVSSVEDVAAAVAGWLAEQTGPGLVVFDNAEDPDVIAGWLPRSTRIQVVVTTTNHRFKAVGRLVEVGTYTEDQAIAYLTERTGLDDPAGAGRVAQVLGCLPLAIGQAAALIGGVRFPNYGSYLDELAVTGTAVMLARVPGDPYPRGFPAAIRLAVGEATGGDGGHERRELVDVLTVLSPDGVPISYLKHLDHGDDATAGRRIAARIETLAERSLVTVNAGGDEVLMHRLVQRTLRDLRTADGSLADTLGTAAGMLRMVIPTEADHQVAYRGVWHQLAPQVRALREHLPRTVPTPVAVAVLALGWWLLYHLAEVSDHQQAIAVGETLAADAERLHGNDHRITLSIRNSLAIAYREAGRLAEAISMFEQVLPIRQRVLGEEHPDTLGTHNNLAIACQVARRAPEAITIYEQLLPIRQRVLGEEHPDTLHTRNNLANGYQKTGRVAEAISIYEQLLPIRQRILGEEHPDTLRTRNNLATTYRRAGRVAEAITIYEQLLPIRQRVLGEEHPETLGTRNNLAATYRRAGRLAEAITIYEQLLAIQQRILGEEHPETLRTRTTLADAHRVLPLRNEAFADTGPD
jgi:tetratricopeptide (TPR) repeat protein